MSLPADLQGRLRRASVWFQVVGTVAVLALAAPLLLSALKAAVALVLLGLIATVAIAFGPLWGRMLANWALRAAVAEAQRNPIETLWNAWNQKATRLAAHGDEIQRFSAKIMTTQSKYDEFVKKYPADGPKFARALDQMKLLLKQRRAEWKAAQKNLEQQKYEIERGEAMYEMAQSAEALQAASGAPVDIMGEIMAKTAITAVTDKVNQSFAQLDRLMLERVDDNVIEGKVTSKELEHVHHP